MLLLLLALCVAATEAFYIKVVEGSKRCFIEEVPAETLVVATYKNLDWMMLSQAAGGQQASQILVTVRNPRNQVIHEQPTRESGKVAFTSESGGEHTVCVSTTTSHWFGQNREFRVELGLEVGEEATDYEEMAKVEHLSAIEVEIRKLNDKVRDIRQEQAYQKGREERFRNTSESTNSRVVWFSIVQTIVLVASGAFQLWSLKTFFQSKKLV
ncbi:MAG: hypothetical protein MHM6MM_000113 [Cercozoa sp. M6MM]